MKFASQTVANIYWNLTGTSEAFTNALADFGSEQDNSVVSHEDSNTVLFTDFSIVHPLATPRRRDGYLSSKNPFDVKCLSVLHACKRYKHSCGFSLAYTPFLVFELFDQIHHKVEYVQSVLNSKNSDEIRMNIISSLGHIPSDPDSLEREIAAAIAQVGDQSIARGLMCLKDLIASKTIRSIFDYVKKDQFFDGLANVKEIQVVEEEIDRFRRPSVSRDPYDAAMHRQIDIFSVLSVKNIRRMSNSHNVYYLGQPKLRQIFGSRINELSRDILTPTLILRSLMESPSDRNIRAEAAYSLELHKRNLDNSIKEILRFHNSSIVPVPLLRQIHAQNVDIHSLVYGGASMVTKEAYEELLRAASYNPRQIKDNFERAGKDLEEAKDMLQHVVDSSIDPDFYKLMSLKPNKRVEELFDFIKK